MRGDLRVAASRHEDALAAAQAPHDGLQLPPVPIPAGLIASQMFRRTPVIGHLPIGTAPGQRPAPELCRARIAIRHPYLAVLGSEVCDRLCQLDTVTSFPVHNIHSALV